MAMSFDQTLATYSALTDQRLAEAWTWRQDGPRHAVREALFRSLDEEHSAAAVALPRSEAAAILSLAQRAFGDLRGLLLGVGDELFDEVPAPGEWTIRQTMAHMMLTELRYEAQIEWARRRSDDEPVRIPETKLPPSPDSSGSLLDLLTRLGHMREETDRRQASITSDEMRLPTVWGGFEVDVRFRLLRLGGHLIEHTIQCEKTLAMLAGYQESEARRIVRHISSARGLHEHTSAGEVLTRLDETHSERARAI
jgi:hypothetical protein